MRIKLFIKFSLTIIFVKSGHCSGHSEQQNSLYYESGGQSFSQRHLMANENLEEKAQNDVAVKDDGYTIVLVYNQYK
jgi:hypothetical protein